MPKNTLHITNGDSLTNYLKELDFDGDMLTWREMLCEGPTIPLLDSELFFEKRKLFLNQTYNIDYASYTLDTDIKILEYSDNYDNICLWFEYDLFCHINIIAVISLLHQKQINKPLYLICSGRVNNEKELKGLSELTPIQLKEHYNNKIELTQNDIDLAVTLWRTYCGKDHNVFKPYITKNSNFKYLTNCLKAHLKRFPNLKSGLCTIEENILKLIHKKDIKSTHHLLGYCLSHQGYYGFGDIQFKRMINKLSIFFEEDETGLKLNLNGKKAFNSEEDFTSKVNNDIYFGGVKRLDYNFSKLENKLINHSN